MKLKALNLILSLIHIHDFLGVSSSSMKIPHVHIPFSDEHCDYIMKDTIFLLLVDC
jgi:hypothetical protein